MMRTRLRSLTFSAVPALLCASTALAANPGVNRVLGVSEGGTGSASGNVSDLSTRANGAAVPRRNADRAADYLTPQDFDANAGSGGDDSAAINAALAAALAVGGDVVFPPPSSGYYNVCAAPVTIPATPNSVSLRGAGGAKRGSVIRILPTCATPPAAVLSMDSAFWGRLTTTRLVFDGWCMAQNTVYDAHSVSWTSHDSVFRNAAPGGATVRIVSGYENRIDGSNKIENVNDTGHICYQSRDQLPLYGIWHSGSDSTFDGLVAEGAKITGFYVDNGGANVLHGVHTWGYLADPVLSAAGLGSVSMQSDWSFIIAGGNLLSAWKADRPLVGGVKIVPWGNTITARAIVTGGILGNTYPSQGGPADIIGVHITAQSKVLVANNDLTSAPDADRAIVQDGDPGNNNVVYQNTGASYSNGTPWPRAYQAPLSLSSAGALQLAWPHDLPVAKIAPSGSVASIVPLTSGSYATTYATHPWDGTLPAITIAAPPAGGTQALAHVVSMEPQLPGAIVDGGSSCAVNDVLTLQGGTVTAGGHPAQIKVLAATLGAATSVGLTGATPQQYSAFPDDAISVSWTNGVCTVATHGITWSPRRADDYVVTSGGAGYVTTPTVTFPQTGGLIPTSTAVLTNDLTLQAQAGQVVLDAGGTTLGMPGSAGFPVLSAGALIDGSGVRQTLGASYTVPRNTSLVRFTQTSTVSASTVTLPTALADGHSIQFVNYAGAVTALTFSPAVSGWANGSTLAAYAGLRVRWDATDAAWHREQ